MRARSAAPLLLSAALIALPALAQSPNAAQSSSSNANQAGAAADSAKQVQAPVPEKKPKKVWTNDDLDGISAHVSVVGNPANSAAGKNSSNASGNRGQSAARAADYFRSQLMPLHNQLKAIDKELGHLRNFKAENTIPSEGIVRQTCCSTISIADQIGQLEAKRKNVQAQIDDLEDQARKMGIEPGQLRF